MKTYNGFCIVHDDAGISFDWLASLFFDTSTSPRDQEAIRGRRSSRTRQHLPVRRGRWRLILFSPRSVRLLQTRSRTHFILVASPSRDLSSLSFSLVPCVFLFGERRATRQRHDRRVSESPPWRGENGARHLKGSCARANVITSVTQILITAVNFSSNLSLCKKMKEKGRKRKEG